MTTEENADNEARPEDPATNTQPPGNGDEDQQAAELAEQKLNEVSGH